MRELMGSLISSRRGCSLFLTNPLGAILRDSAVFLANLVVGHPAGMLGSEEAR